MNHHATVVLRHILQKGARNFASCSTLRFAEAIPGSSVPKNVLLARGTIIRPSDDGSNTTAENIVGKIRKTDVCKRYNLQPRECVAGLIVAKRSS